MRRVRHGAGSRAIDGNEGDGGDVAAAEERAQRGDGGEDEEGEALTTACIAVQTEAVAEEEAADDDDDDDGQLEQVEQLQQQQQLLEDRERGEAGEEEGDEDEDGSANSAAGRPRGSPRDSAQSAVEEFLGVAEMAAPGGEGGAIAEGQAASAATSSLPPILPATTQDTAHARGANNDAAMRTSVRNMFVQLFRRLNMQREQENDEAQAAMRTALEAADETRADIFARAVEASKIGQAAKRRRRGEALATHVAPWAQTSAAGVFCCAACDAPICRPQDVALDRTCDTQTGPRVVMVDTDPKRALDLYARATRAHRGPLHVFSPRTQPNWSYEAAAVSCPACSREIGVHFRSVAHRGAQVLTAAQRERLVNPADKKRQHPDAPSSTSSSTSSSTPSAPGSVHFREPAGSESAESEPMPEPAPAPPGPTTMSTTTQTGGEGGVVDTCTFPTIIKKTALYGSPRVLRVSMDAFDEHPSLDLRLEAATGRLIREMQVHRTALCGRYLRWSPGPAPAARPSSGGAGFRDVLCRGRRADGTTCTAALSRTDQLLCAKRTWRKEDRSKVNAVYVNALAQDAARLSVGARVERLSEGYFTVRDVCCASCETLVGASLEADRSDERANAHKERRFVLFTDSTRLALP